MSQEVRRNDILSHQQRKELIINPDGLKDADQNLHVSYVVPIRGEVANGNFFKQIRNFTNQREANKDSFEVLYVRNNAENDFAVHDQFEAENNTIYQSVQYIQGDRETFPDGVEEWQAHILSRAKQNKLRVQTIEIEKDTLVGRRLFGDYINASRIMGENLAVERFRKFNRNGAIVCVDADTYVGADTTSKVRDQLLGDPQTDLLRIAYDMQLMPGEGGMDLFHTSPALRFQVLSTNLHKAIVGNKFGGMYAVKSESLGIRDTQKSSLVAEHNTLFQYEGYTKTSRGIKLAVQDRSRMPGIGGAYSAYRRSKFVPYYMEPKIDPIYLNHPAFSFMIDIYETHRDNAVLRGRVEQQLAHYFPNANWLHTFAAKINSGHSVRLEADWRKADSPPLKAQDVALETYAIIKRLVGPDSDLFEKIVEDTVRKEMIYHEFQRGALIRAVEKAFTFEPGHVFTADDLKESQISNETEQAHFFRFNQWLLDQITERRANSKSAKNALAVIGEQMPEYAKPFAETKIMKTNALLAGMIDFLDSEPEVLAA